MCLVLEEGASLMEIVGKVAATIQNVLGAEAEGLGRATGVIERRQSSPPSACCGCSS